MEERVYTSDEVTEIKAEAYERGFRAGEGKINKIILKNLIDFISKALSL